MTESNKTPDKLRNAKHIAVVNGVGLKKVHAKRLRDMYRSAGWPCLDVVEIELLAAGLLERLQEEGGHERMRVTDVGIQFLAQAADSNRQVKDPHEALVEKVAHEMLKEGRLVWTNLGLRAKVTLQEEEQGSWRYCMPDVFSIRNSSVQAYLEPIVHEIDHKVLNEVPGLENPTAELIAVWIWQKMIDKILNCPKKSLQI